MHAAERGYVLLIQPLLAAGANPDERAADGATALFIAAVREHAEIVSRLIEGGANPAVKGPKNKTALDVARDGQNMEVVMAFGAVALEPKCPNVPNPGGTECWNKISNKTECYLWNSFTDRKERRTWSGNVTWSGDCLNGVASGRGKQVWMYRVEDSPWYNATKDYKYRTDGKWKTASIEGMLKYGKAHGQQIVRYELSDFFLVNGRACSSCSYGVCFPQGRYAAEGEIVEKGPVVNGRRHGVWVEVVPNMVGNCKGRFVWIDYNSAHKAHGVREGRYEDGQKHGVWIVQSGSYCLRVSWRHGTHVRSGGWGDC